MNETWPRKRVSDLCDLIVDCVNKTAPSAEYETPYRMIRTPNIKNGVVSLEGCRYVERETFEKWTKRATVVKGDVLLTREAPMGEVGIFNSDSAAFLGQRIMQYRVNNYLLDNYYLLYSFLSPDLKYQFRRHNSTGSIVSHIRVPDCHEFEISTPPLVIQKKISQVLKDIDKKIELNNRMNTELEAMAKMLYDYWFIQFDFPDVNGKPYKTSGGKMVYNEILKRKIPEGWEIANLASWIAEDKNGDWGKDSAQGNHTLPVNCIRGADINGLNGKGKINAPHRFILEKNRHKLLCPYEFIIEISGGSPSQSTGRIAPITADVFSRFSNPIVCSTFVR